ncbi:MAG: Cof-type HAD-IIB family hydrolase [Candidatus Poribacteria bacterium]|nr:Cof-type HAD-IIB family hydrolase [Candidatus Poribacteria bacterium]
MESESTKIPCRLAAFDLDGTLLNSEHGLPPKNCEALRALAANDILVVLVSGRMHRSIQPISDEIGLENPIISYNGGMVRHATSGEVYHHIPVPADYAMAIVDACNQRGLHLNFCLNDELYVAERNAWSDLYEARTGVPATPVGNLRELAGETPTKMLIIHISEELPSLLNDFQTDYAGKLYVTQTQPEYIEFMNPEVTKGRALSALANRFAIPIDSVVAFGDSYNDESLLKTAGFGIAMANGVPPIRACADYITGTNDDNGVAKAIWELIL